MERGREGKLVLQTHASFVEKQELKTCSAFKYVGFLWFG